MKEEYREIEPELLAAIKGDAWSIENMAAHGADGRVVEYIGSSISHYLDNGRRQERILFDYYKDSAGAFWFRNRALLPTGEIISMDRYIFGREIKKDRYRHTPK